jgi:hypothetical protein
MKAKVKKKKDENLNFDYMKTTKDNIKNVIRNENLLSTINDIVIRTNKIVIHSYQFLKLYLLDLYKNNKSFPVIDKEFICDIFKVITIRKCNTGGYTKENMPEQQKILQEFYNKHYKETTIKDDILYYDKMSYILAYEAIDMETNINVNIQEHFLQHLYKFINILLDVKGKRDKITEENKDKTIRKEKHKELTSEINLVKKDLTSFSELKSNQKYHQFIKKQRKLIYGDKVKFDEDNIVYDLKTNTQTYLKSMFYIASELEKIYDNIKIHNENIKNNDNNIKQIRLFNVIPLRTNIISKHITLDTCGILSNFLDKSQKTKEIKKEKPNFDSDSETKIKYSEKCKNKKVNTVHDITVYNYTKDDNQNMVWNHFFKLNKKPFKKNKYEFNHMIRTDGISICVLFVLLENGKPMSKAKGKKLKGFLDSNYIENVKNISEINKKFVVADPGKSDIIYCGSKNDDGELETFRYTQNQRRLELGTTKYKNIIHKVNTETKIDYKTIKEIESTLSLLNSKTVNYDKFKEYLIEKNKVNHTLFNHYQQKFFRKFKLNSYTNTQKSESKLINNFSNKYGKPEDTIFVIGDYDTGSYNMKGVEPIICKRIRRIFKNAGYESYLINEYCTSKFCNCCHNELDKFLIRKSNKPKDIMNNKNILVNGLLRHEVVNPDGEQEHLLICKIYHNRDKNAVQNMISIIEELKKTGKRPLQFTRKIVEAN